MFLLIVVQIKILIIRQPQLPHQDIQDIFARPICRNGQNRHNYLNHWLDYKLCTCQDLIPVPYYLFQEVISFERLQLYPFLSDATIPRIIQQLLLFR